MLRYFPKSTKREDWLQRHWRPVMGWTYMVTCVFDFIIFPVLWALIKAKTTGDITMWTPLTLQGAGLYHMSMGAILGIAAWSRGKEKIAAFASAIPFSPMYSAASMMPKSPAADTVNIRGKLGPVQAPPPVI
jgi:hypothetical protein